jgi:hypothetical protein
MKFLEGIPLKTLKTMSIAFTIILVILGGLVSVQPLVSSFNQRATETDAVEGQKALIESNLERYASLQDYVTELNAVTEYLVKKFPPSAESQSFIEQVYLAAEATGITSNQIIGINPSTPTQIVVSSGQSGEAICAQLEEGDEVKIFPDPQQAAKAGDSKNRYYVVCTEDFITRGGDFYNAATVNAARQCSFRTDVEEGNIFYLEVSGCTEGAIVPAVYAETMTVRDSRIKVPTVDVIAEVDSSLAQIGFTISLDTSINVQQLTSFINNLYKIDRAVSIISINSQGGNGIIIRGSIYSHTKPTTLEEFGAVQQNNNTEGQSPDSNISPETPVEQVEEQPNEES